MSSENLKKIESPHSPFNAFTRSTMGKKLYFNDPKAGPLPPPKVN
jgi:hypothetical protein